MKKTLLAIGFSVLFGVSTVFGATETKFPVSGIDEEKSFVDINYTNTDGLGVGYSCPTNKQKETHLSFEDAGWNSGSGAFSNLNCFSSAGKYAVKIEIYDKAGNKTEKIMNFNVKPGVAVPPGGETGGTVLNELNCSNNIADNNSTCELELILKDRFGNKLPDSAYDDVVFWSPTADFNSDEANLGNVKFRSGLREEKKPFGRVKKDGIVLGKKRNLKITALAPSIQKILVKKRGSGDYGKYLSKVVSRSIEFHFTGGGIGNKEFTMTKDLKFRNPYSAKPTISNLMFGENLDISTKIKAKKTLNPTPSNFKTSLESFIGEFCKDSTCENLEKLNEEDDNLPNPEHEWTMNKIFREPTSATEVINKDMVALITYVSYELAGETISYPAGAVGGIFENENNSNIQNRYNKAIGLADDGTSTKFIGADIEGLVGTDPDKSYLISGNGSEKIVSIGTSTGSRDIYEEITKNGWSMARNAEAKITNNGGPGWQNNFGKNDVVVVDLSGKTDRTYAISGKLPAGQKTLIVIDGNLVIKGNLEYNSKQDSFGVIMLRNEAGAAPKIGNIFVRSDVQKIAGSFFADGGFMNNDENGTHTGNAQNSTYQLLLEGSLLSRNTLGGSLRQDGGENDYSPWTNGVSNEIARRYDLHFVRRYDSSGGSGHIGIPDEANTAAFIIRPDQKSAILPPPGFKVQ